MLKKKPQAETDENKGPKTPRESMNAMYKLTRHIYDASRRFYLFGRDHLIDHLNAKPDEHIIEVGCGTARNLIKMAYRYSNSYFYGIDASDEMLKTARQSLLRLQLADKVPVMQGLAQDFDYKKLTGDNQPDKIVFSYVLSMIPDAKGAIDHAMEMLPSGGEIHIVDFCHLKGQPAFFQKILRKWLTLFHVKYDPQLLKYIKSLNNDQKADVKLQSLYKDYAYYAVVEKN